MMNGKRLTAITLSVALLGTTLAPLAQAEPYGYGHHWRDHYHYRYDPEHWRGGRWVQSWHGGRYGWWWLVGTTWLLYPGPVYPYPDPEAEPIYVIDDAAAPVVAAPPPPPAQAPVAPPPPPQQVWYYCNNPQGYYPTVPACPSGWQTVPATPPDKH